jgi:hypothetical protein
LMWSAVHRQKHAAWQARAAQLLQGWNAGEAQCPVQHNRVGWDGYSYAEVPAVTHAASRYWSICWLGSTADSCMSCKA